MDTMNFEHKQIEATSSKASGGEEKVVFDVVVGPGLQELITFYGEQRLLAILKKAIPKMYRDKATTMIRANKKAIDVMNAFKTWRPPGGPLAKSKPEKALEDWDGFSDEEKEVFKKGLMGRLYSGQPS